MFDVNSLNLARFRQNKKNIYVEGDIYSETIYKYTSLSILCHLLASNGGVSKFRISNRDQFSDRREKGEFYDLRNYFRMRIANTKPTSEENLHWAEIDRQIKNACHLYTSCWTCKKDEDFLMWKAYSGTDSGVRIETTVEKLMNSLHVDDCQIVAAKMKYGPEKARYRVEDALFYKTIFYKGEDEFRFYVIDNAERSDAIWLEVEPQAMIEKIVLSPFIDTVYAQFIRDMLCGKYPFLKEKVMLSQIMEYRK